MPLPELKPVKPDVTANPGVAAPAKPDHTPEELKALLQADRQAREQRAADRIKQVLAEERCVMNPVMVLKSGNVSGRIEITAVD